MRVTIEVHVEELMKFVKSSRPSPIGCKGATQSLAEPTTAFVEVLKATRTPHESGRGVSYVLCPRLKTFFNGHSREFRCYEGDFIELDGMDREGRDETLGKSLPCLYYFPERED